MIEILPHKIATPFHRIMKKKIYEHWETIKNAQDETGIAFGTISNVCSGKYSPRMDTVAIFLKALGLDLWVVDSKTGENWRLKI